MVILVYVEIINFLLQVEEENNFESTNLNSIEKCDKR